MKNLYEIEFYDIEENVGKGICKPDDKYTNKKVAIQEAKSIFNGLCNSDKENLSILVNKYDQKFDEWNCIFEISKNNFMNFRKKY